MLKFKKVIAVVLAAGCLIGNMSALAASSSASVSIAKSDTAKESSTVGVSTKAYYAVSNSATSTTQLTMQAYACWVGWPFTCESITNISPSGSYGYTEGQSKDSNFYIRLIGNKRCSGSGSVALR